MAGKKLDEDFWGQQYDLHLPKIREGHKVLAKTKRSEKKQKTKQNETKTNLG